MQKFWVGKESLEDEEYSGQPTSWERSSKLILLQLQEKLPKNSASNIRQSFSIWSKLERWVQFSRSVVSGSLQPHELHHARPPCPLPNPRVHPNPSPSSRWCSPTISSSVVPFSSCPQSFSVSESFPVSQLFASDGQSIGVSASASVLPMNTQDWSLGWTDWISLHSKGFSRVFSKTTVEKHQLFGAQLSS